jgi:hypothetical protein
VRGALSLVLKPPIVERCQDAGLRGCDDLADGVIEYAAGDREEAKAKLKTGAATNAPDKLREFAAKLRMLKSIPGAAEHMGPILEVADLLARGPPAPGSAAKSEGVAGQPGAGPTVLADPALVDYRGDERGDHRGRPRQWRLKERSRLRRQRMGYARARSSRRWPRKLTSATCYSTRNRVRSRRPLGASRLALARWSSRTCRPPGGAQIRSCLAPGRRSRPPGTDPPTRRDSSPARVDTRLVRTLGKRRSAEHPRRDRLRDHGRAHARG